MSAAPNTPQAAAHLAEQSGALPAGAAERFSGYAVMGVTFASGDVLELRRFTRSSIGPAYTSVWHRDPSRRWTFYSTVPPELSCARYFGGVVWRNIVTPITLTWITPWVLRVSVQDRLDWRLEMQPTLASRLFNVVAGVVPESVWNMPAWLNALARGAHLLWHTGPLNFTGHTPNRQCFVAHPRQVWLLTRSRAVLGDESLGETAPLGEQAALGDFRLPRRGLFATAHTHLGRLRTRESDGASTRPTRATDPASGCGFAEAIGRRQMSYSAAEL